MPQRCCIIIERHQLHVLMPQLIEEVTRNKRLQRWRAIMAAWQRILPDMFPSMKVCPLLLALLAL